MFSPLEQFAVIPLLDLFFFKVTNMQIFISIVLILLYFTSNFFSYTPELIPNFYQSVLEFVDLFIYSLVSDNIGKVFLNYFIFIKILFLSVFMFNVSGLVPYVFTVTSHIVVTFFFSFISFLALNFLAFLINGLGYIAIFLPSGIPLFLAPFLVLIEFISYLARVFSLAIRLFANIMSGHTLMKILYTFSLLVLVAGGVYFFIFLLPISIVSIVSVLEVAIAFLQAYVFVTLVCLYYKDALVGTH